jgi:nitroimidazol reductase NimA-like FMN-containing flavoprotein (pyridoxamine 5'-phosphate oxidase superfamily)
LSRKFIEAREQMKELLTGERVGYLGMSADGKPYVIPLTYGYADGKIIFHCALKGSKLDIIRQNANVCFTVSRHFGEMVSHPQGAECHINSDSVICYGKARIIDSLDERCKVLNIFNRCLQPQAREITLEEVKHCHAVEIVIDEMTGRSERDGKCTYWKQANPSEKS